MRNEHGWITGLFRVLAAAGFVYLLLPIVMLFPLSVEPGELLRFPPQGWSLRWYGEFLADEAWIASTLLSVKVATGSAIVATVLGTLAAVGLTRLGKPARDFTYIVLMSPIFLPTIVVAVAIYGFYTSLHLVGTPLGLITAHAVICIPFVVQNVLTALRAAPRLLEDAAMSLGAGPAATFFQVTLPLISKGILAGGIFAFLVSFDEVVIAMFLSGTSAVTLPKRMLEGVHYEMTPMLAAISVLLVLVNVMLAAVAVVLLRVNRR